MTKTVETEVLVIGGGGAGARATLEAYYAEANVTLVVKGKLGLNAARGSGATGYRGPGRALHLFSGPKMILKSKDESAAYRDVPLKVEDEPEVFFNRAIQAGLGMANRNLTRILVNEARESKQALERWGVVLDKSPYIQCLVAPMPGLGYAIKTISEIDVLEDVMVTGLLIQDGVCTGAVGLEETSGDPIHLKAKSTVLATGGNAQLFKVNLHPSCVTGDGNALGYEAGAELINMEFGQAFIATVYPTVNAVPYNVWKLHPRILNKNGEDFVHNYLPHGVTVSECMDQKLAHGPFSSRDIGKYLDIAMIKETKAGRANENGAFYLEIGGLKPSDEDGWWKKGWLEFRGIDLRKEFIEINVTYHCSNGGLRIDENGQTTIPGLYAVGETATGPYGADRLGGSMMTSSQVFGARAGKHAAARAKATKDPIVVDNGLVSDQLNRINNLRESNGNKRPHELVRNLKKVAWENLLVVRSKESLLQLLDEIQGVRHEMRHNLSVKKTNDLIEALEINNLLLVGEIIAKAALMRTESRGSHYREDFPERDDKNWLQSIIFRSEQNEMKIDVLNLDEQWQDRPDEFEGLWWG